MNNRIKFFKNVLLFQFIPIFILGLLILSSFREQKILRIRELHPYEFNYGYAVPLIVFGAGLVLSVLSLLFKQENLKQEEGEDLKKLRRQNFWKFAFYCNLFLVLVIMVFYNNYFKRRAICYRSAYAFLWINSSKSFPYCFD